MYVFIYIYVYRGVPQRGVVAARAPSALLNTTCTGTATSYIPPVADLRFSNKPCLKVAKLNSFAAKTHIK